MDIQASYKVLGIESSDDFNTIKAAHRKMIKSFHPDKHATDAEARERAEEQSKMINNAFESIKKHLESSATEIFESMHRQDNSQSTRPHWSYGWGSDEAQSFATCYRRGYEKIGSSARDGQWKRIDRAIGVFHSVFMAGILGFAVHTLGIVEKVESFSQLKIKNYIHSVR